MKVEAAGANTLATALVRVDLEDADIYMGAAAIVARAARARAPRRTGALAASVQVRKARAGAVVLATTEYAQYVSYGSIHNPRPYPFLTVAARGAGNQIAADVERRVNSELRRVGL